MFDFRRTASILASPVQTFGGFGQAPGGSLHLKCPYLPFLQHLSMALIPPFLQWPGWLPSQPDVPQQKPSSGGGHALLCLLHLSQPGGGQVASLSNPFSSVPADEDPEPESVEVEGEGVSSEVVLQTSRPPGFLVQHESSVLRCLQCQFELPIDPDLWQQGPQFGGGHFPRLHFSHPSGGHFDSVTIASIASAMPTYPIFIAF